MLFRAFRADAAAELGEGMGLVFQEVINLKSILDNEIDDIYLLAMGD
jgi:hypothetical protein